MEQIIKYGLTSEQLNYFKTNYSNFYLGRVIIQNKGLYKVITEHGVIIAELKGSFIYNTTSNEEYPAVGDFVVLDRTTNDTGNAIIHHILPRTSLLRRKEAGQKSDEQIIASNINIIFICMSLNEDFNLRKLERYLVTAWDSNAKPVIILTKSDLCNDINEKLEQVRNIALGVDIIVTSIVNNRGIDQIENTIKKGKTVAFMGASGIGKSSLINSLMGKEKQKVNEIRIDGKGRHTTTHRELILLPNGGIVIDTPGMREIQLLDVSNSVESFFSDIEELANKCRFKNCNHESEPGCAVKKAIQDGELPAERFKNYIKMQKETIFMDAKIDKRLNANIKKKNKQLSKYVRDVKKYRY